MIKVEKGNVRLTGTGGELFLDFTYVTKGLYQSLLDSGMPANFAKTTVRKLVDLAMTEEPNKPSESAEPKQEAEPERNDPVWSFAELVLAAFGKGRD